MGKYSNHNVWWFENVVLNYSNIYILSKLHSLVGYLYLKYCFVIIIDFHHRLRDNDIFLHNKHMSYLTIFRISRCIQTFLYVIYGRMGRINVKFSAWLFWHSYIGENDFDSGQNNEKKNYFKWYLHNDHICQ